MSVSGDFSNKNLDKKNRYNNNNLINNNNSNLGNLKKLNIKKDNNLNNNNHHLNSILQINNNINKNLKKNSLSKKFSPSISSNNLSILNIKNTRSFTQPNLFQTNDIQSTLGGKEK